MIKNILTAILITTFYLPLNAIQINAHIDVIEPRDLIRCNVLLEMIEEGHSQSREICLKNQLLTELKILQYRSDVEIDITLKEINSFDLSQDWHYRYIYEANKRIEKYKNFIQELKSLESYCEY